MLSIAFTLLFVASDPLSHTLNTIFDGRLVSLTLGEDRAVIGLELPEEARLDALPVDIENAYELAVGAIAAARPQIARIDLLVRHPGGKLIPPLKHAPDRKLGGKLPPPRYTVVPDPMRFPDGQALLGKTVAISPGHGYIYYDNLSDYATQRGRVFWTGCGDCRGIVEDFETHEIVVKHLIPLFEGSGARVVLLRERDYNPLGATVDDSDASGYAELSGMFTAGTSPGGHAGTYRATGDAGGTAELTITAPVRGRQLLSSWFVEGMNRTSAMELQLAGSFGTLNYIFDQRTHGRRWTPIAVLDLELGETVRVKMTNPASDAMITDAVRLGAGTHSSGHPLWQMGAFPFAQYQEAPNEVLAYGDVTIRPRYSEFYGADVYVAVHSNASGVADSTAAGLSSYRYNCGAYPDHSPDPPASDCDDPPGSDRLQELIHTKMVERLRAEWDPSWIDRGPKVANFGELRELDGIPGVLIESAFHDQTHLETGSTLKVTDNQSLHDPRWRRNAAYAIYAGVSEYLAGPGPLLLFPPKAVAAKRVSATELSVDFELVPGATRYRVYLARGGRSFDLGRIADAPPAAIDGLTPEEVVFVRVAALNAAGEGPPSAIITARPSAKRAQLLLVDGFEREDAWIQDVDNLHDTLLTHGAALADTNVAFDGATESALAAGMVELSGHDGVILALGAESTEHGVLTEALRNEIAAFARDGGAVFASGSEIAWTLDSRGDDTSRAFLAEVFGASFGRDDAAVFTVSAMPGGWIASALMGSAELDDGTKGALRARSSDVLSPLMTASIELDYGTGMDAAAVRLGKNMLLAFALDSLTDPAARSAILGAFVANAIGAPIEPSDAGMSGDAMTAGADGGKPGADAGGTAQDDAGIGVEAHVNATNPAACGCTVAGGSDLAHSTAPLFSFVLYLLR